MNVCPTFDQMSEWFSAVGIELLAMYIIARGSYILHTLHKNRESWNCGNLTYRGKKCGLVLDVGGYYKNVFTIAPSLYISDDEIAMAIDLLDQLFKRCL